MQPRRWKELRFDSCAWLHEWKAMATQWRLRFLTVGTVSRLKIKSAFSYRIFPRRNAGPAWGSRLRAGLWRSTTERFAWKTIFRREAGLCFDSPLLRCRLRLRRVGLRLVEAGRIASDECE